MTAIVGIVHGGKTWIGGDSCVSDSHTREVSNFKKVWKAGGYLIGAAGNGGWFAVLRHMRWPQVPSHGYINSGIVGDIIAAARALDIEIPMRGGTEEGTGSGAILIGGCGKLWYLDSDLSVDEYTETAIGSGGEGAKCVLRACKSGTPKHRITKALEAVSAVRYDVAPPFFIENI